VPTYNYIRVNEDKQFLLTKECSFSISHLQQIKGMNTLNIVLPLQKNIKRGKLSQMSNAFLGENGI
jgi:hypothetical protein